MSARGALTVAGIVSLGSAVTGMVMEHAAKARGIETAQIVADQITAELRTHFERPIGASEALKAAIVAARERGNVDRAAHNATLRATLANAPELLSAWTAWEPNAFDGRDAAFASTPGHDASGRFVPTWGRSRQRLVLEPLHDYDKPDVGDWYLEPIRTGRPLLTETDIYPVEGQLRLMTSVVLPIREGGRNAGVVGVDVALDDLSRTIDAMKLPFDARIDVLSDGNLYVYTHNRALLGKPGRRSPNAASIVDDPNIGSVVQVVQPIRFQGFDTNWVVRVKLPMSAVLADARTAELTLLISALVMIVVLASVLRLTATRVVGRPLASVTAEMGQLAAGDLSAPDYPPARSIEIALMRKSVDVFRHHARAKREADREQQIVVANLAENLQRLAQADLSRRITVPFSANYDQIKVNYNAAIDQLSQSMTAVSRSAADVSTGSGEISVASDDMARRTEQQAAALEQTAAAMDEITMTVRRTAEDAGQANTVVRVARDEAEQSGEVVRRAVAAMAAIERSAAEIADIITVIDSIAFQTNLLALNAGVEAARAGDSGRGFAVVASEVRALAQRSADAAKDVKERILTSNAQVDAGVALVTETGKSLDRIIQQIGTLDTLVGTIADSARQQASGLHQVNVAVGEMDSVTQRNAAMVEQTNASARGLAKEADVLAREVGRFRLESVPRLEAV